MNPVGGMYNNNFSLMPLQAASPHAPHTPIPHYAHPHPGHPQMQMAHPNMMAPQIIPPMQQYPANPPPYQYPHINQQNQAPMTATFNYRTPVPPIYQSHNPSPMPAISHFSVPKPKATINITHPVRRKAVRRKNKIKRRLLERLDRESQRKLWKLQAATRQKRTTADIEHFKTLCAERKRLRSNYPRPHLHAHKRDLISKCILKLDDFVGLVSEYNGLRGASCKNVISKVKSETKFVAYIQKLCNFLREPRFMPLCIWKRVQQNLVKLAAIAKTVEGAYLKDQLLLKELYYAAYERQDREHPDRSFQLPRADFSPFKKRQQKLAKVETCPRWFNAKTCSRRTICKKKRKRRKKVFCCHFTQPLSFPETLKSRHARPCINFNWAECKAGSSCVNPHKCSGCGSKNHSAKFCTKVSMEFNWKCEKYHNSNSQIHENRMKMKQKGRELKCLGCGSTKHGAKKCQHLLPIIRELYCESFNGRFRSTRTTASKKKSELYKYYRKRKKTLQRKLKKKRGA